MGEMLTKVCVIFEHPRVYLIQYEYLDDERKEVRSEMSLPLLLKNKQVRPRTVLLRDPKKIEDLG